MIELLTSGGIVLLLIGSYLLFKEAYTKPMINEIKKKKEVDDEHINDS